MWVLDNHSVARNLKYAHQMRDQQRTSTVLGKYWTVEVQMISGAGSPFDVGQCVGDEGQAEARELMQRLMNGETP